MFFPPPRSAANFSVTAWVRLKTATENPFDSMLRTRFSPMTARPISPISHCFVFILSISYAASRHVTLRATLGAWQFRLGSFDHQRSAGISAPCVGSATSGAVVDFWGVVRGLEEGREINGIEYEAHRAMAEHQMDLHRGRSGERILPERV